MLVQIGDYSFAAEEGSEDAHTNSSTIVRKANDDIYDEDIPAITSHLIGRFPASDYELMSSEPLEQVSSEPVKPTFAKARCGTQ